MTQQIPPGIFITILLKFLITIILLQSIRAKRNRASMVVLVRREVLALCVPAVDITMELDAKKVMFA